MKKSKRHKETFKLSDAPSDLLYPIVLSKIHARDLKRELLRRIEIARQYLRIQKPRSKADEFKLFVVVNAVFPRALTGAGAPGRPKSAPSDTEKRSLALWIDRKASKPNAHRMSDAAVIKSNKKELAKHFSWVAGKANRTIANWVSEGRRIDERYKLFEDVLREAGIRTALGRPPGLFLFDSDKK